jgi:hypothetical protein
MRIFPLSIVLLALGCEPRPELWDGPVAPGWRPAPAAQAQAIHERYLRWADPDDAAVVTPEEEAYQEEIRRRGRRDHLRRLAERGVY